jgi:hypothetical protein
MKEFGGASSGRFCKHSYYYILYCWAIIALAGFAAFLSNYSLAYTEQKTTISHDRNNLDGKEPDDNCGAWSFSHVMPATSFKSVRITWDMKKMESGIFRVDWLHEASGGEYHSSLVFVLFSFIPKISSLTLLLSVHVKPLMPKGKSMLRCPIPTQLVPTRQTHLCYVLLQRRMFCVPTKLMLQPKILLLGWIIH